MQRHHSLSILVALLVLIAGLQFAPARAVDGIQPIQVPAAKGSGMYTLTADSRSGAYLSWLEPAGQEHALRFSTLSGGRWSAPRTVARGRNWFVNWADKPSVVAMQNGSLAAHWLVNNETKKGSYGYGIRMAYSRDQGATWREVFSAGADYVSGYSGFVSFLPGPEGLSAVYLTPKRPIPAIEDDHTMTLNFLRFTPDGVVQSDRIVDADACSCCTTSLVRTARGPIVAYRDHEAGEIRDISIVRAENGRWTAPAPVHRDGWVINAYRASQSWSLFAGASTGLSLDNIGGAVSASGTPFEPERSRQVEAGVKRQSDRLSGSIAFFNIIFENATTGDPNNPHFSLQIGEQRSRGVEIETSWRATDRWFLSSGLAVIDATITRSNDSDVGKLNLTGPKGAVTLTNFRAADDRSIMAMVADKLPDGVYTVAWQAAGDDGHVQKGGFTFTLKRVAE